MVEVCAVFCLLLPLVAISIGCSCLPTHLTLVCGGGESGHPAFGPPASLSL